MRASFKKTTAITAITVNALLLCGALYLLLNTSTPLQNNQSAQQDATNVIQNENNDPGAEVAQNEATISQVSLEKVVVSWSTNTPGEHSVSVLPIGTGTDVQRAELNAHTQMVPASTYKLFLAYAVLSQEQVGSIEFDQIVAGDLKVSSCLEQLIVVSSDVCAYELGGLVGWQEIDVFLRNQGYLDTSINNYDENGEFIGDKLTTAADLTRLLTLLDAGLLLNEDNTDFMLSLMKEQVHTERIKAGLPVTVEVANKPGWIDLQFIQNDAAIVYAGSTPYVLVVLSEGAQVSDLSRLSRQVYSAMTSVQ